jgi:hypothetical protein
VGRADPGTEGGGMTRTDTAQTNDTVHLEWTVGQEPEPVYPCRCGVTHRGQYASYDYGHHNCPHRSIVAIDTMDGQLYCLCDACGAVLYVDLPKEE